MKRDIRRDEVMAALFSALLLILAVCSPATLAGVPRHLTAAAELEPLVAHHDRRVARSIGLHGRSMGDIYGGAMGGAMAGGSAAGSMEGSIAAKGGGSGSFSLGLGLGGLTLGGQGETHGEVASAGRASATGSSWAGAHGGGHAGASGSAGAGLIFGSRSFRGPTKERGGPRSKNTSARYFSNDPYAIRQMPVNPMPIPVPQYNPLYVARYGVNPHRFGY